MSRSARPASFRPEIDLPGENTRILVEQVGAVGAGRLGELVSCVRQRWLGSNAARYLRRAAWRIMM